MNTETGKVSKIGSKSPVRTIALLSVGVLLMASSFSGVRGGVITEYSEGGDDDLSGGEIAGIVGGTTVAGLIMFGAIGGDDDDDEEAPAAKGAAKGAVTAVRVSPERVSLTPGSSQNFDVQVRYAGSNDWKSVTGSSATSIRLVGDNAAVTPVDGTKNAFAVPVGAASAGTVRVEASYNDKTASAAITVN